MMAAEQSTQALDMVLRPMQPSDQSFVYNTWLNHFRQGLRVPKTSYYEHYVPVIRRVLEHRETGVIVAANPVNPTAIYGWLCWSQAGRVPLIHYVYVRGGTPNLRRLGIGWALFCEAMGIERPRSGGIAPVEVAYTFNAPAAKYLSQRVAHAEHVPVEEYLR